MTQGVMEPGGRVLPACLPETVENDADLARLVVAWPMLSEPIRRGILAIVHAATER